MVEHLSAARARPSSTSSVDHAACRIPPATLDTVEHRRRERWPTAARLRSPSPRQMSRAQAVEAARRVAVATASLSARTAPLLATSHARAHNGKLATRSPARRSGWARCAEANWPPSRWRARAAARPSSPRRARTPPASRRLGDAVVVVVGRRARPPRSARAPPPSSPSGAATPPSARCSVAYPLTRSPTRATALRAPPRARRTTRAPSCGDCTMRARADRALKRRAALAARAPSAASRSHHKPTGADVERGVHARRRGDSRARRVAVESARERGRARAQRRGRTSR